MSVSIVTHLFNGDVSAVLETYPSPMLHEPTIGGVPSYVCWFVLVKNTHQLHGEFLSHRGTRNHPNLDYFSIETNNLGAPPISGNHRIYIIIYIYIHTYIHCNYIYTHVHCNYIYTHVYPGSPPRNIPGAQPGRFVPQGFYGF